jgi:hypothetical protein
MLSNDHRGSKSFRGYAVRHTKLNVRIFKKEILVKTRNPLKYLLLIPLLVFGALIASTVAYAQMCSGSESS